MLVGFATSTIHFYLALLLTFLWYSKKRWETIRTRKWNYPSFRTSGDGTSHMDPNDKSYSRHCWFLHFNLPDFLGFYGATRHVFHVASQEVSKKRGHSFSVENGKKPLRSTRMNSVSTLAFFKAFPLWIYFKIFFFKSLEDLGRSLNLREAQVKSLPNTMHKSRREVLQPMWP